MGGVYVQNRVYGGKSFVASLHNTDPRLPANNTALVVPSADSLNFGVTPWYSSQTTSSYRTKSPSGDSFSESFGLKELSESLEANKFDTGHEFSTEKRETLMGFQLVSLDDSSGNTYSGPLRATWQSGPDQYGAIPSINIASYGPRAINITRPTAPVSGIANLVGEGKQTIPKLIGASFMHDKTRIFKNLGDEYLNIQFGWLPFVSDIIDICHAIINAKSILDQYRKDAGKLIRRRYSFPPITSPSTTVETVASSGQYLDYWRTYPPYSYSVYGGFFKPKVGTQNYRQFKSSTLTEKYSFSGAYTYLLQDDDSFLGRLDTYAKYANKLLGIKFTPDVLWELTPWSWLVDWEFNIGVNLSNAVSFNQDNLVLKYGYLMRETSSVRTVSVEGLSTYSHSLPTIRTGYNLYRKERVKATPFGFGLNPSSFTARQWSILAALGLTKAPRTLR